MAETPAQDDVDERTLAAPRQRRRRSAPLSGHSTAPRSWLPTGRALMGGVLIACAATGVLVAHRAATQPPTTRFVVLTRDVDAGAAIRADDLGTVAAELPDDLSVVDGAAAEDAIGRVARVPLRSMDLLRTGDLFETGRFVDPTMTEVVLDLTPAQALFGTITDGDRVEVLSTDPDRTGTATIASDVLVTDVAGDDGSSGIGATGTVRIRLGLPDRPTAEAVVDAAVRTDVTLALPGPARSDGGAR